MPLHDKSRATLHTFLNQVLDNYASNLARSRRREKLKFSGEFELDAPETDTNTLPIRDQLSTDLYMHRSKVGFFHEDSATDLKIDVQIILEQLPEELQEVCYELMRGTAAEAAQALGISRATLYRRLAKIRKYFVNKGLERG